MKPVKVSTPALIGPAWSSIEQEPLGVYLVMGSWNYPLFTSLGPAISAIAAGNCVVVKPSEMAPYSSRVIKQLITKHLDFSAMACIEGGVQVAIALTSKNIDGITFTGSTEKGKLVA